MILGKKRLRRRLLLFVAPVVLVIGGATAAYAADALPFTDISGHWAEQSIKNLASRGIIKGHDDGTFGPDEFVTRAQVATFLDRVNAEANAPVAARRGCPDCHVGNYTLTKEAVSRGGAVHAGLSDSADINVCLGCHAPGTGDREGKGIVAPISLRDIVHPAHMGSKIFTEHYVGNCFTCHNVSADGTFQVLTKAVDTNDKGVPDVVPIPGAVNPGAGGASSDSALVAAAVSAAPTLDGVANEAFWATASELVIPVAGGYNNFSVDAKLKAVYTADSVYFLLTYADPTESWFRSPWQRQADGTWKQIKDPNDRGGDNNKVYEDKFAMIWPISNSIRNFETAGCFVTCHAGENSDVKPYGNKYTASQGELGDIWHWKSVRMLGQVDDQYLDSTRFDPVNAVEAGRKSDAKTAGGYSDNFGTKPDPADPSKTVADKTKPGFTSPAVNLATGAPGYILAAEKVALDQAALDAMPVGAYIPGIVKSAMVGDRGDISAGWKWENGKWTIEFGRKLVTGSQTDVQFSDLGAKYFFGLAIFENAQVRHAYENGASYLAFGPR